MSGQGPREPHSDPNMLWSGSLGRPGSECIIREFPTEIYYDLIADEGERLNAEQELIRNLLTICSGEVRR